MPQPELKIAVDAALAALAWVVQLIAYPVLAEIPPERFPAWHAAHARRISYAVVPLMLAQVFLHVQSVLDWADAATVAGAVLVAAAWTATFLGAVPCHARLRALGFDPRIHRRLLRFNLARTLAWTGAAAPPWGRLLRVRSVAAPRARR